MVRELDPVDRRIIANLQRGSRISNREVARQLGLSEAAVRKRLDRLQAEGAIQFFVAADPARLGLRYSVVVGLKVVPSQLHAVTSALKAMDAVTYLGITSGAYELLAVALFRTEEEMARFLVRQLPAVEGVLRIDTAHVLQVAKRTVAWGLPTSNGLVGEAGSEASHVD